MSDERTVRLEAQMDAMHTEHAATREVLLKHVDGCEKVREGFREDIVDLKVRTTKMGVYVMLIIAAFHIAGAVVITNMVKGQLRTAVDEVVTDASDREARGE